MTPKHKEAITYGVYAIIASFCLALLGSVIPLGGLSFWCTISSALAGIAGVMFICITLADHFDS
jgi:hypothetical protein